MTDNLNTHQRHALKKSMSFGGYISIGLGSIVGIAWVMYTGQWLQTGGPVGAMIAFALCGVLLMPVGACYAEMTSSVPVAGGALAFVFKAFGTFPAFVTAWGLALVYVSVGPFETIAIGTLMESIAPAIATEPLYTVDGFKVSWSTIVPGFSLGAFLIWLNYRGAKSSARFQLWVVYLMFACVIVFCATALIKGDVSNLTPMFATDDTFWAVGPSSIIAVLVTTPFFMAGWDAIPQAAEESGVSMKPEQLGFAILASIAMGAVFYVVIILSTSMSVSAEQMGDIMQRKDVMPTAEVFRVAFGYEWATKLVLFAALMGLATTLNAFLIAAPRLLFSFARGGMLPHWFAQVHPTHGTPGNATLFVGAITLLGPFVGLAALGPMVNSGSLGISIALLMTCLSTIRLRKKTPDLPRPYRASNISLYVGVVVALIFVCLMIVPASPGQLSLLEFSVIGVWVVLGTLAFAVRHAKGDLSKRERSYMILGDYR